MPETPRRSVAPTERWPEHPARAGSTRGHPLEDSAIDGLKILVVDDDFRNIFAMTALLERGHADVIVAESGAEAIAVLERTPDIDIVLMDIMMPVMDGYETIRAIRAIDRFKSLPIIAVTGKVTAGERQRCLDAGANDYVPKPVDTAELLAALRPWLPDHRAARGMSAAAARTPRRRCTWPRPVARPHPGRRRQRREAAGTEGRAVAARLRSSKPTPGSPPCGA